MQNNNYVFANLSKYLKSEVLYMMKHSKFTDSITL